MDFPELHDLPSHADGAPEPVQDALAAAHSAGAIRQQARDEHAAALAAVDQADAVDRAADQKALAAGKPMPAKKAGPAARSALAEAQRKLEAAEAGYADAVRVLTRAMMDGQREWLDALEAEEQAESDAAREALAAYADAADRLAEIRGLRDTLEPFRPDRPKPMRAWLAASFYRGKRASRSSAEKRSEIRNTIRGLPVNIDRDRMLVELELLATGEQPWVERQKARRPKERWVDESEVRR